MITCIHPYRNGDVWLFDAPEHGLVREAFVCGASEAITRLVPRAERCALTFGDEEFPGADVCLRLVGEEAGGARYRIDAWGHELWLCSALYCYFPETPPERIWARAEANDGGEAGKCPTHQTRTLLEDLEKRRERGLVGKGNGHIIRDCGPMDDHRIILARAALEGRDGG